MIICSCEYFSSIYWAVLGDMLFVAHADKYIMGQGPLQAISAFSICFHFEKKKIKVIDMAFVEYGHCAAPPNKLLTYSRERLLSIFFSTPSLQIHFYFLGMIRIGLSFCALPHIFLHFSGEYIS